MDQNGHVIVVDNKACTVFIFQLTGRLITKFGSRGNGDKQFAGNCMVDTQRQADILFNVARVLPLVSLRPSFCRSEQEQRGHRDRLPQPLCEGKTGTDPPR